MPGFDGYTFQGVPFRGEISLTDATTQVANTEALHRFALYPPGSTVALSVGASDSVAITDVTVYAGAAGIYTIYDGSDINADNGELLFSAKTTASVQTYVTNLITPVVCQTGTYPKLIGNSTAAAVVCIIGGVIKRSV